MTEKRSSKRTSLDIQVNKIVHDRVLVCRATNISSDGIYLSSLMEPDLDGNHVAIEFSIDPYGESLWAFGEVVRQEKLEQTYGMGVRFTAMPQAYREAIESFITMN